MAADSLKIASWNIADGLSSPDRYKEVIDNILRNEANVVTLPEAFAEEASDPSNARLADTLAHSWKALADDGYEVYSGFYDDADGRRDRHAFALLHRTGQPCDITHHIGGNIDNSGLGRIMSLSFVDAPLSITGVHLDDRSEETRLDQAATLLNWIEDVSSDSANVVMGDFNAMHAAGSLARALRWTRPLTYLMPSVSPGEEAPNLARLRRKGSLAQRLSGMATGFVMGLFENAGFEDADPGHRPTMGPVQLDHIMIDFMMHDEPWMTVEDFEVGESTSASDHRPISAVIRY